MIQARLKILLPALQSSVAIGLLILGSRQVPRVLQDSPPFVPPAKKICAALNAPVMLLEVGAAIVVEKLHVQPGSFPKIASNTCFLAGVELLWFYIGMLADWYLQAQFTLARALANCAAIVLGVILAFAAVPAWRQEETILALGLAVWSFGLVLACSVNLLRDIARLNRNTA